VAGNPLAAGPTALAVIALVLRLPPTDSPWPAAGSRQKVGTMPKLVVDDDLDTRDLNQGTLRIHLLGVEHALGIHGFSMPCPPDCPLEEITHSEARNRAALILRGKTPSGA
jgi:hypothetical protein